MITLTEKAANEVKRIVAESAEADDEPVFLRVRIVGAGCSGFSTKLDLDHEMTEKDVVITEQHGVKVVSDNRSVLYLDDASIDFKNDLNQMGFKVDIASAKSVCGWMNKCSDTAHHIRLSKSQTSYKKNPNERGNQNIFPLPSPRNKHSKPRKNNNKICVSIWLF